MTPQDRNNLIFSYIKEQTQHGKVVSSYQIENFIKETPKAGITATALEEILKKMEYDKLIISTQENSQPLYQLSFGGHLFNGYN